MIKAILFDLDGTLINTNKLVLESFRHAFKTYLNIEVEEKEIIRFFGEPLQRSMEKFGLEHADGLVKTFKEFNEKMHDELAERYEGVEETLKLLKDKGIKLGVVTSKRELMAFRSLRFGNIFDYMDVIITPESTQKHKPHPEPIYKACEVLEVKPEECIMVGDSIYDIQCGLNAGCETCVVTYTEFDLDELKGLNPQYLVENLVELVDIIDKGNRICG